MLVKVYISTYDPDPESFTQPEGSEAYERAIWDEAKDELTFDFGWPKATRLLWIAEHVRLSLKKGDKLYALHIQGHGDPGVQYVGQRNQISTRTAAYLAGLLVRVVGKRAFNDPFHLVLGGCRVGKRAAPLRRIASILEQHLGVKVFVQGALEVQYFLEPGFEGDVRVCSSTSCRIVRYPKNTYDIH